MAHAASLREMARRLRQEENLTIDQLAARLALSRTTVYYWVRDLPIERQSWLGTPAQRKGCRAMQRKHRLLREEAYERGRAEFATLATDPIFRDFVNLYIAEGYKRCRNRVSVGNSDPAVVKLSIHRIRVFARNKIICSLQYHADQNPDQLRAFWAAKLGVSAEAIQLQRKSNSNGLKGRKWRSRYGVLTVCTNDTLLRARLQGWIDRLQEEWLDFLAIGA